MDDDLKKAEKEGTKKDVVIGNKIDGTKFDATDYYIQSLIGKDNDYQVDLHSKVDQKKK